MGLTPPVSSKKKFIVSFFMTNFANLSMDTTYNTLYFNINFRSRNALYFEGVYLN